MMKIWKSGLKTLRLSIIVVLAVIFLYSPSFAAGSKLIDVNLKTINEMNFDCRAIKDIEIEISLNGRKAGSIKDGKHLSGKPAIMYKYVAANNKLELKFLKRNADSEFTCKLLSSSITEREIFSVSSQDIPVDAKSYTLSFNIKARGYYPDLEPMLVEYEKLYARLPESKLPVEERLTAKDKADEIRGVIISTEMASEEEARVYIQKEIDSLKTRLNK